MKKLIKGKTVLISDINNLTYVEKEEKEYFKGSGRKSVVDIPLMTGGNVMGMIGITSLREKRYWPDDLVQRFRLIGEIFANALIRKRYEESLNKAYIEIKQLKEQIKADYTYLQEEIKLEHNFDNIIGKSKKLKSVLL
jgi:transcriptional regulator with GAF, ATPase, and Fis domain